MNKLLLPVTAALLTAGCMADGPYRGYGGGASYGYAYPSYGYAYPSYGYVNPGYYYSRGDGHRHVSGKDWRRHDSDGRRDRDWRDRDRDRHARNRDDRRDDKRDDRRARSKRSDDDDRRDRWSRNYRSAAPPQGYDGPYARAPYSGGPAWVDD